MSSFVITGGHHNSALVLAQYFINQNHTIYWYGHRQSSRSDHNDSAEYQEVTTSKIKFFDLPAGRALLDIKELIRLPRGFFVALSLLRYHRPQAVISFGGYLGASTALAAIFLRIPVFLHEQTVVAGKANRFLGHYARKIYLTWPSSKRFFPRAKTVITGLPLRPSLLKSSPQQIFSRKRPILLIMGGKQGAHILNKFIFDHIHNLLNDFNIVHQTGTNSETNDYDYALKLKDALGSLSDCYLPLGYITENEIGNYLHTAQYYLGRSGAHITYELMMLGLKSILVPYDATHQHEQCRNAEELVKINLGIIINQNTLSLSSFYKALSKLTALTPKAVTLPHDATQEIYNDITRQL